MSITLLMCMYCDSIDEGAMNQQMKPSIIYMSQYKGSPNLLTTNFHEMA